MSGTDLLTVPSVWYSCHMREGHTMDTLSEATRLRSLAAMVEAQPRQPLDNAWSVTAAHGMKPINTLLFSQAEQVRVVTDRLRRIATRIEWAVAKRECAA